MVSKADETALLAVLAKGGESAMYSLPTELDTDESRRDFMGHVTMVANGQRKEEHARLTMAERIEVANEKEKKAAAYAKAAHEAGVTLKDTDESASGMATREAAWWTQKTAEARAEADYLEATWELINRDEEAEKAANLNQKLDAGIEIAVKWLTEGPARRETTDETKRRGALNACDGCGSAINLRRCTCFEVWYCQRRCQEGRWALHKAACKAAWQRRSAAAQGLDDIRAENIHPCPSGRPTSPASARLIEVSTPWASRPTSSDDATDAKGLEAVKGEICVRTVLAAMSKHMDSAVMQAEACRLLNSALDNDTRELSNATQAMQANAAEVVAAGMRRHAADESVQSEGCRAFMSLFLCDVKHITKAGCTSASEAVVAAMRGHARCGPIQANACGALHFMAFDDDNNVTRAGNAPGAIKAVVAALRGHLDSSDVQHEACGALNGLTSENAEAVTCAGRAGALEAVVASMLSHPESAQVQTQACRALWSMTLNNKENRIRARHAGAIEALAAVKGRQKYIFESEKLQAMTTLMNGFKTDY